MLLESTRHDVTISDDGPAPEVAKATIKATAKNFATLSSGIYSDNIRACIRELSTNAIDAHTAAGNPNPIEVFMPTLYALDFKVKDEGIGMPHSFMMSQFLAYGDGSTKDRDNSMVGGLGLGSKSPFSYTDQFNLTSTFDGERRAYVVYLDGDGVPSIRLMQLISSNEPNGVEISFPVKLEDLEQFQRTARDVLQFMEPMPVVHGLSGGELEAPSYTALGDTWAVRDKAGQPRIIMGGICYKAEIDEYKFPRELRPLLKFGLDLKVPIGTVPIAVSRESIRISDDAQLAPLIAILEQVNTDIAPTVAAMFEAYPSYWEACAGLAKERKDYNVRADLFEKHATYHGKKVLQTLMLPAGQETWEIAVDSGRRRKHGHYRTTGTTTSKFRRDLDRVAPGSIEAIVICDAPKWSMSAFQLWVDQQPRKLDIVVLRGAITLDDLGNPPAEMVYYTSDMPLPPRAPRLPNGMGKGKTTADTTPVRLRYKEGREQTLASIGDLTGYCYVAYKERERDYHIRGVVEPDQILFVHVTHEKRMQKLGIPTLVDENKRLVAAYLKKHGKLLSELRYVRDFASVSTGRDLFQIAQALDFKFSKATPLGKIIAVLRSYLEPLKTHEQYISHAEPTPPKGVALTEWLTASKGSLAYHLLTESTLDWEDTKSISTFAKVL